MKRPGVNAPLALHIMPIKQPVMILRFLADNKQSGLLGQDRSSDHANSNKNSKQTTTGTANYGLRTNEPQPRRFLTVETGGKTDEAYPIRFDSVGIDCHLFMHRT
jgi:hypothetical protein